MTDGRGMLLKNKEQQHSRRGQIAEEGSYVMVSLGDYAKTQWLTCRGTQQKSEEKQGVLQTVDQQKYTPSE